MKTRHLLFALLLCLLAGGAYFFYKFHYATEKPDIWTYVPESAIMVYESDDLLENWKSIQEKPVWNIFSSLPYFKEIESNIDKLDSLGGKEEKIAGLLHNKQVLVSIHAISKDEIDYLYFFELGNVSEHSIARQVLKSSEDQPGITNDVREYNGFNINELKDQKTGKRFSYLIFKNFFMGSFTPFLVEDVIRTINEQEKEGVNFRKLNRDVFSVPKLTNDEGNLYLNFRKIPLLLSTFTDTKTTPSLQKISRLCDATFLDIDITNQQVMMSGFSAVTGNIAESSANGPITSLLGTFQKQKPGTLNMTDYIPEETAIFYHFTFNQPTVWQNNYAEYLRTDDPRNQLTKADPAPGNTTAFPSDGVFSWLAGEMGLATLESVDVNHPDKLLLLQVTDTTEALQSLIALNNSENSSQPDSIYSELFGTRLIREITYSEFPAAVWGSSFSGFDRCFFTFMDNYLVLANSMNTIKKVILDQELESTWRKSVKQSVFLESINDKANVSIIINTARAWEMLKAHLSPKWQQLFDNYSTQIKAFDRVALQFSNADEQYYTSIALQYRKPESVNPQEEHFTTEQNVLTENIIISKPFVVKSTDNLNFEVIVQDSAGIYLTSRQNGILWKDSVKHPIVSDLQQIDFYNNGKLQYFFATAKAIYVIDRNGDLLEGYPLYMPDSVKISRLSLIDYDNSKRYRFLVTDETGNLYMFNKEQENLKGWTPRLLGGPLAADPFHLRVRGKDMIIAAQADGKIYVLNRQGEVYPGFPLDLKDKLNSPLFVEESNTFENTILTTITENGEITAFNLRGNIVRKEQLYRPSTQTFFRLCIDALANNYIIARQDLSKISILNRNGTLIFEKNYISPGALSQDKLKIQYYNFGAGNEVYAITDKIQEFTYLYDGKGQLYNNRPFESGFEIGLIYSEADNSFRIYRTYAKEFSIISLGRSS